jgi:hypothetical protein
MACFAQTSEIARPGATRRPSHPDEMVVLVTMSFR